MVLRGILVSRIFSDWMPKYCCLLGNRWRGVWVSLLLNGGAVKELVHFFCHYLAQGRGSEEDLNFSFWSCFTLDKQLTFTRRGTGAQEVWPLRRRPARLLIHAHTCVLSQWIVNVLLRVEQFQEDDSNLLPGSNTWLSANMLFVPLEMSLLLHNSFFFSSSKCPSLFQLIFVSLLAQTLPSTFLLDPERMTSVPPLYLRLAESVEGPKVVFPLNQDEEGQSFSISTLSPKAFKAYCL